jgi:hypothetical protein
MTVLTSLHLHHTKLHGVLPSDALSFNQVITSLDLSYNNLTGIVPSLSSSTIIYLRLDANPLLHAGSLPPWAKASSTYILSSEGAFSCPLLVYTASAVSQYEEYYSTKWFSNMHMCMYYCQIGTSVYGSILF